MITFFTTFKDFKGKNRINQFNAIRSWLALGKDIEVIIFSESEDIETVLIDPRIKYIKDIQLYKERIPLIGPMFNKADKIAINKVCCFINGDIMVTKKFLNTIKSVDNQLKENYLLVGQRNNIDVEEEIKFDQNWENRFFGKYEKNFELYPACAMDYFVFPKGQYENLLFPTLLVGRPGWDLWMIYNALKSKIETVDLSFTVNVIHQNHDYNHKIKDNKKREKEDSINYKVFPCKEFYFFTAQTCKYIYKENQLKRNYARGDVEFFLRMQQNLLGNKILNKVLLLLISEHSIFSSSLSRLIGTNAFNLFVKRQLNNI